MPKKPEILNTLKVAEDVRATNNHPIITTCGNSNLINKYVIKHTKSKIPCERLAIELIAHYFLKLWKIDTPEIALINVKEEHLLKMVSSFVQPSYFKLICFGSQYLDNAIAYTSTFSNSEYYQLNKFDKLSFFKLAFFDIWMANEDRNANNPNLLIQSINGKIKPVAIDHEHCFNSNNLTNGLYSIGENESILYDLGYQKIIKHKINNDFNISEFLKECYFYINECEKYIVNILSFIPLEWKIDTKTIEHDLINHLFSETWIKESVNTFKKYLSISTK